MSASKGYYSLIQFCPDRSRMETVNVGVVLLCPTMRFVRAQTSEDNTRIRRVLGPSSYDRKRVNLAKKVIERRINADPESFLSRESLIKFKETRANDFILTDLRSVRITDPEQDLAKLFDELVDGSVRRRPQTPIPPALEKLFRQPLLRGRVDFDAEVRIPQTEDHFRFPFAFRNGCYNYVKPQRFPADRATAIDKAKKWAINGDLISRTFKGADERKLIIVSSFETPEKARHIETRIAKLLKMYNVTHYRDSQIDDELAQMVMEDH